MPKWKQEREFNYNKLSNCPTEHKKHKIRINQGNLYLKSCSSKFHFLDWRYLLYKIHSTRRLQFYCQRSSNIVILICSYSIAHSRKQHLLLGGIVLCGHTTPVCVIISNASHVDLPILIACIINWFHQYVWFHQSPSLRSCSCLFNLR